MNNIVRYRFAERVPRDAKEEPEIVYIEEAVKRKGDTYRCPKCKRLFDIKDGDIRSKHFAHKRDSMLEHCDGGQETALHLYAKNLIAQKKALSLPGYEYQYPYTEKTEILFEDMVNCEFDAAEIEEGLRINGTLIRPDVILTKAEHKLAVEILVSHKVDEHKIKYYEALGISAIEIDLSDALDMEPDKLDDFILYSLKNKKWLNSVKKNNKLKKLLDLSQKLKCGVKEFCEECPKCRWNRRNLKNKHYACSSCEYCLGKTVGYVYCAYENAITCQEDLEKDSAVRVNQRRQKLKDEDRDYLERGICPVCLENLNVIGYGNGDYRLYHKHGNCVTCYIRDGEVQYYDREGEFVALKFNKLLEREFNEGMKKFKMEQTALNTWEEKALCPKCNKLTKLWGTEEDKMYIICENYGYNKTNCKFNLKPDWKNNKVEFKSYYGGIHTVTKKIPERFWQEHDEILGV